jgi:hypothetical protein
MLLIGGLLALAVAGFGLSAAVVCVSFVGARCLGISLVVALPAVTGIVSLLSAVVVYARPAHTRVAGAATLAFSLATIGVGLALWLPYPAALLFVIVLFAWPVVICLVGGILAVSWKPASRPPWIGPSPTWP